MRDKNGDNPGVLVFPPALFGGALIVGLLLHWLTPWRIGVPTGLRMILALTLIAAGVAVAVWGSRTMERAGTNVNPMMASTTIVQDGPFRYSRNPLYLSLFSVYVGILLAIGTAWLFVLLLMLAPIVEYGIVRREERYLERKFGDEYRGYQRRVRRWL